MTKTANMIGSYVATSTAYAGVLAALFLFAGISVAQADTTYVVDATNGNGACGAFCQQLQNYLNGNGNPNNGYNNGYNNGGNYSPTSNPYFSVYGGNTGGNAGNGGYQHNAGNTSNPNQYPYTVYNYYQNPNPSGIGQNSNAYNPYGNMGNLYGQSGYIPNYTSYPNQIYVPYPQAGSSTVGSYSQTAYGQNLYGQNTYGQNAYNPYGNNTYGTSGSGFVRTSGY